MAQAVPRDRLEKLTEKMKQSGYSAYKIQRLCELVGELCEIGVNCLERFLQLLLDRVNSEQDYYDIFMEGRIALLLAKNGFQDLCLEFCEKGPDIKCMFEGSTLFFEVRRRRPIGNKWENDFVGFIKPYPPENIVSMVDEKIGQLQKEEINIIAFWSDNIDFDRREIGQAAELIEKRILEKPEDYGDLSCLLYVSGGYDMGTLQQCYAFPFRSSAKPPSQALIDKLNSSAEEELSIRQQHKSDLTVAFEKLKKKREIQIKISNFVRKLFHPRG